MLARTLAADVLASAPVVLAMRVLAGGPHAVAAAIELAEICAGASTEGKATSEP